MLGLAASKATKSAKARMSSSFEKSVRGATKIKVFPSFLEVPYNLLSRILTFIRRPHPPSRSTMPPPQTTNTGLTDLPSSRYIEHILIATHSGEAGVAEVFRVLQNRLRDSTWTVVFKSLITVHLMIREGSPDATLSYLSKHKSMLSISNFADGMWLPESATQVGKQAGDSVLMDRMI